MRFKVIVLGVCLSFHAFGMGNHPQPTPTDLPPVEPSTKPKLVEVINYGVGVNRIFAAKAVSLLNEIYSNGCLKQSVLGHHFVSLNTVFEQSPHDSKQAFDEYASNAPHKIDLRWYTKLDSTVIGYTYNFRDNTQETERRIYSNTKYLINMSGYNTPEFYAAHLAHESSHQAQAGGFVHYTVFNGSFPYDIGTIASLCIRDIQ